MKFTNIVRFASVLMIISAVVVFFTGCAFSPRTSIENISDLPDNKAILVGRIEIDPPLGPQDQELSGQNARYKGKVLMMVHEENVDLQKKSNWNWYLRGHIEVAIAKTFYVAVAKKPFYYLKGIIMMDRGPVYQGVDKNGQGDVQLPGGLKVDIRTDDRAVYIGTIHYSRDEFFSITDARIEDNYERENVAFVKKFGKGITLRRAVVKVAKE